MLCSSQTQWRKQDQESSIRSNSYCTYTQVRVRVFCIQEEEEEEETRNTEEEKAEMRDEPNGRGKTRKGVKSGSEVEEGRREVNQKMRFTVRARRDQHPQVDFQELSGGCSSGFSSITVMTKKVVGRGVKEAGPAPTHRSQHKNLAAAKSTHSRDDRLGRCRHIT